MFLRRITLPNSMSNRGSFSLKRNNTGLGHGMGLSLSVLSVSENRWTGSGGADNGTVYPTVTNVDERPIQRLLTPFDLCCNKYHRTVSFISLLLICLFLSTFMHYASAPATHSTTGYRQGLQLSELCLMCVHINSDKRFYKFVIRVRPPRCGASEVSFSYIVHQRIPERRMRRQSTNNKAGE